MFGRISSFIYTYVYKVTQCTVCYFNKTFTLSVRLSITDDNQSFNIHKTRSLKNPGIF